MNTLPEGIEPALSWKSVVSMVKQVMPGDTIGYGRSFIVNQPMMVATIPTGYADDLANIYGTIGYEVVCGIKKR